MSDLGIIRKQSRPAACANSANRAQMRNLTAASLHRLLFFKCCHSRKYRRKNEFALIVSIVFGALWILANAAIPGAVAFPANSIFSTNLWERPCGDGRWNGQSNKSGKMIHIVAVFDQTKSILNTLNEIKTGSKAFESMDADFGHHLIFNFPKISTNQFTFTKTHRALQQYLAMFSMFVSIANHTGSAYRTELMTMFETMGTDSRNLLCQVESVINSTHLKATGGSPKFKYITHNLMERKMKPLKDLTNNETFLLNSKVIFDNYQSFVHNVHKAARLKKNNKKNKKFPGTEKKEGPLNKKKEKNNRKGNGNGVKRVNRINNDYSRQGKFTPNRNRKNRVSFVSSEKR